MITEWYSDPKTTTSSIPFVTLSYQLFQSPFFTSILHLIQPQFEELMEKILYVKQPNENDFAKMFPKIWFNSKYQNAPEIYHVTIFSIFFFYIN